MGPLPCRQHQTKQSSDQISFCSCSFHSSKHFTSIHFLGSQIPDHLSIYLKRDNCENGTILIPLKVWKLKSFQLQRFCRLNSLSRGQGSFGGGASIPPLRPQICNFNQTTVPNTPLAMDLQCNSSSCDCRRLNSHAVPQLTSTYRCRSMLSAQVCNEVMSHTTHNSQLVDRLSMLSIATTSDYKNKTRKCTK